MRERDGGRDEKEARSTWREWVYERERLRER